MKAVYVIFAFVSWMHIAHCFVTGTPVLATEAVRSIGEKSIENTSQLKSNPDTEDSPLNSGLPNQALGHEQNHDVFNHDHEISTPKKEESATDTFFQRAIEINVTMPDTSEEEGNNDTGDRFENTPATATETSSSQDNSSTTSKPVTTEDTKERGSIENYIDNYELDILNKEDNGEGFEHDKEIPAIEAEPVVPTHSFHSSSYNPDYEYANVWSKFTKSMDFRSYFITNGDTQKWNSSDIENDVDSKSGDMEIIKSLLNELKTVIESHTNRPISNCSYIYKLDSDFDVNQTQNLQRSDIQGDSSTWTENDSTIRNFIDEITLKLNNFMTLNNGNKCQDASNGNISSTPIDVIISRGEDVLDVQRPKINYVNENVETNTTCNLAVESKDAESDKMDNIRKLDLSIYEHYSPVHQSRQQVFQHAKDENARYSPHCMPGKGKNFII